MALEAWKPSFVVGIDFGMTCSGIGYSSSAWDWGEPRVIQDWPGAAGSTLNKYPTRIAYNEAGQVADWGECRKAREPIRIEREFKLYLDPQYTDTYDDSPTHEEAKECYIHYMTELYKHQNDFFVRRFPNWHNRSVEYRFSIPTTWKHPRITGLMEGWLAAAGFAASPNRKIVISQTEAEAAAVYAAKHFQKDDVIMVVDAGGATTDVNVLKVLEKQPDLVRLEALDKAEGISIGSVLIDESAKRSIASSLEKMGVVAETDLKYVAEEMMENCGFERFKCNYDGVDPYLDQHMEVPGNPGHHVVLRGSELKQLFAPLITDIVKLVQTQITQLHRARPHEQLSYILLSGGLGSSKAVQRKLEAEFCAGVTRSMNATNLKVLLAADPQIAVVKGLVMDRSQAIHRGVEIYTGKCARVSYGVLCRLEYNPKEHIGEQPIQDKNSKKLWVEDQIDWLIKEGEQVSSKEFSKRYSLKIARGEEFEPVSAHIVMSEAPAYRLPMSKKTGAVTKLCTVTGNFTREDFLSGDFEFKKRLINKDKEYTMAHFDLKVIVGTTDLGFELVSMHGKSYSQKTEKVQVQWDDIPIPAPPQSKSTFFPYSDRKK